MTRISNSVFLTVLNPVDTTLTAVQRRAPTGAAGEILQPFQFDTRGGVAFTDDPVVRAQQHLLSLLFTRPGERVMKPTYGCGIQDLLFEGIGGGSVALAAKIKAAVSEWEPTIDIVAVTPVPHPAGEGLVEVKVSFKVRDGVQTHTATFDFNGNRVEI